MNTIQSELQNLQHKQQLLGLLVFSLVTIAVWISISLIVSQGSQTISAELQELAKPLNPNIDLEVITTLEQKRHYDPSELAIFPIYTLLSEEEIQSGNQRSATTSSPLSQNLTPLVPSPTPTPSPTPEASPSALSNPQATQSGSPAL